MLTKVRKTIQKYDMLQKGDHVLVGVSGGADSVVLLAVLNRLHALFGISLSAAHFNHRMRGSESDRDEKFVRALCESLGISLLTGSLEKGKNAPGLSVEDFLRRERYVFFEKSRQKAGAHRVALGHNQNDQAETVLMNVIRGTGLAGLSGMPPVRNDGVYIRPLIDCSRREITDYLTKEALACVQDNSNSDVRFLRNRIRHGLMPELENRFNPAIRETLCRQADILRDEQDYMNRRVCRCLAPWRKILSHETVFSVPIGELRTHHAALQRRIVLEVAREISAPDSAIGFEHVQAVLHLAGNRSPGGSLDLPGRLLVQRSGGLLSFSRIRESGDRPRGRGKPEKPKEPFRLEVSIPGTVFIESLGLRIRFRKIRRLPSLAASKKKAYLDVDRIAFPLVLRSVKPGDRIQPLGMKGTRKLKSVFIDDKIPRKVREDIPVLADGISVLWVPGIRLSERVRVGKDTKHIVSAEII